VTARPWASVLTSCIADLRPTVSGQAQLPPVLIWRWLNDRPGHIDAGHEAEPRSTAMRSAPQRRPRSTRLLAL
jgi:hypothetical protein